MIMAYTRWHTYNQHWYSFMYDKNTFFESEEGKM